MRLFTVSSVVGTLLAATLPRDVHAATVTEIPPFLRGDVGIGYTYDRLAGSLAERGEPGETELAVGERAVEDHLLAYRVAFGVAPGAAVFATLPHYARSSVSYGAWSPMVYDPATGSGTYAGTAAGDPGTLAEGEGVGGVWFGARGTPFSEAFTRRNNRATWLLEGAIRTADETNFATMVEATDTGLPGTRGAGPGGWAYRLHSAFSTTYGKAHPYVAATYVSEGAYTTDLVDDDGTVLAKGVEIDPGDTGRVLAGIEAVAGENPVNGSRTAIDVHLALAYTSWGTVPTGVYLPSVLEPSAGAVQQAESLEAGAGLAIHWRPFSYMQFDLRGDFAWHMPQRLESPYPVYTDADTVRATVGVDLTVRIR